MNQVQCFSPWAEEIDVYFQNETIEEDFAWWC